MGRASCRAAMVFAGSLAMMSPASSKDAPTHYAIVAHALEVHVVPGFEALKAAAGGLPEKVEFVCADGTSESRKGLEDAFRSTAEAWAAVEFLRFGPLSRDGQRERFSFWPDPRGVMERQLRQIIAAADEKILEPGTFVKQSAAVQGLPALEYLMADKAQPLGPGDAARYRCRLAGAIAANLKSLSADILTSWTAEGGYRDKMLRPGSDNDTYKEPGEAAGELLKALLLGMQFLSEVELKPRLATKGDAHRAPPSGPFARTGNERVYYGAGAKSLNKLYDAMRLEDFVPEDKAWIKGWMAGAWKAIVISDGMGGPAPGVKAADAPKLRELVSRINGARQLIGKELSTAANLAIGFNELDGD